MPDRIRLPRPRSSGSKGFALALGGTMLVSTNFVTAKYGLGGFEPVSFSFAWTGFATLFSLSLVLLTGRARQLRLAPGDRPGVLLLGAATGLGMIWGWTSLSLLDPSFSAFLHRFVPVITMLLGMIFLGERVSRREALAMALMVAGGAASTLGGWSYVALGVFFALLNFLAVAVQHLVAKAKATSVHPTVLVFYRCFLGFLVIAAWGALRGGLDLAVPGRFWLVTALGALLGPCLAHVLTYRSLFHWELSRTSMTSNLQPLFVLPLAYLFLGRFPDRPQLLGGAVILAGAWWLFQLHRAREQAQPVLAAAAPGARDTRG